MRASLEGHKSNAQYGGRASPSDSAFHPQTTKQNIRVATLTFSAELNYECWNFNSGNYLFTTDTK